MLNKLVSLVIVAALVTALCGTSAFASSANSSSNTDRPEAQPTANSAATEESPANEKLRTNMLKLVSDAKAGKVASPERSQIQPAKKNNLSKGTKIAIGVGIAVAVVAVVLIATSPILNDGR